MAGAVGARVMRRILGVFLASFLVTRLAFGGELPPPTPRKDRPVADELYFRRIQREWLNLPITTTIPDGNIRGKPGDELVYHNLIAATYKHCINVSTTGEGTIWVCASSAYTAP